MNIKIARKPANMFICLLTLRPEVHEVQSRGHSQAAVRVQFRNRQLIRLDLMAAACTLNDIYDLRLSTPNCNT